MLHRQRIVPWGHRGCSSTNCLSSNWEADRTTGSCLTEEVAVDVRSRKKQLRLLLCKLWKAMRPSCMLPSWLLHSAVMLLPWAAFPKRVGLLYAVLYFEKKDVTFSIATIAIYKLCCLKNVYLSTTGNSERVQTGVTTVDRMVYISLQYYTDASSRISPSVFKHCLMV